MENEPLGELTRLGKRFGTDKVAHGFTKLYDAIFSTQRSTTRRMLEVGVFYGASIRMWHDYFPAATIHGVDAWRGLQGFESLKLTACKDNERCRQIHLSKYGMRGHEDDFHAAWQRGEMSPRIVLHTANQSNATDLEQFASSLRAAALNDFDIIIEDGSHIHRDQLRTLGALFPFVRPGGWYVIEDVHTSLQRGWGERPGSSHTTLAVMKHFNHSGALRSRWLRQSQQLDLEAWIDAVQVVVTGHPQYDQVRASLPSTHKPH
jgi:hypothetical protein